MPLTEQDLRESLRRATDAPPRVADRLGAVERRVRRRRRRIVVGTAVAVVVALAAVPLAHWLPDRLNRNEITNSEVTPEQMDAMMQYATFVTAWSVVRTGPVADTGVVGVAATVNLPPYNCIVATPEEGQPSGTQAGWVIATPSIFAAQPKTNAASVVTSFILWPRGVTSCDAPGPGVALTPAPAESNLLAWQLAFSQRPSAPSTPALDVAAIYAKIPQDRLTDVGRAVFEGYQKAAPKDYGSSRDQVERVLQSLAQWLAVALSSSGLTTMSPASGPTVLSGDVGAAPASPDGRYVGTAELPAGYSARWVAASGAFCLQGSVGDSGVMHLSASDFTDYSAPPPTPLDGPCPTR